MTTTLKELKAGDIFYNTRDTNQSSWWVTGEPVYNLRTLSYSRMCMRIKTREEIVKSCKIPVEKIAFKKV
jgi:hypothetical protein